MSDKTVRTDAVAGDIIHVYDGIEEADNQLPMWWLWTLFAAVIFGAGYWMFYESFHFGKSPLESYNAARLAALDTGEPVTGPELLAMKADKQALKDGGKIFSKSCTRCHGDRGEGKIGPNLTDPNWIGEGSPTAIFETIYRGRGGKGMQAWGPTYGRGGVMQITAYVLTLQNTNVPGKAAEGTVWVPPPPPDPAATGVDGGPDPAATGVDGGPTPAATGVDGGPTPAPAGDAGER